jgi:antitoxin (DNA-binding transcriptional repressor) of toxin-antitoxin stability system
MDQTVAVERVFESFPAILLRVRDGETFVLVSDGEPVARLVPAMSTGSSTEAAKLAFLAELAARPPRILVEGWTRDELHDD